MANDTAIYVDLDGTLAHYDTWIDGYIGEPVPAMVERVRNWLAKGYVVKVFTARADRAHEVELVREWLVRLGPEFAALPITNIKGMDGIEFWDDRAVAVERNTGRQLS